MSTEDPDGRADDELETARGCLVCASNEGTERISPGPVIHRGDFWQIEHAYPTSLLGWLVIVLRRHAEALHELTGSEAAELGVLQRDVASALREELDCSKEYAFCLGEAPGFSHLHVHLVPRAPNLKESRRGIGIFGYLDGPEDPVPAGEVGAFCERLATVLAH